MTRVLDVDGFLRANADLRGLPREDVEVLMFTGLEPALHGRRRMLERWGDLWPSLRTVLAFWLLMFAAMALPTKWRNSGIGTMALADAMRLMDPRRVP